MPTGRVYFTNLDGLRTIAFLFVYIQHCFWNSFEKLNIESDFLNRFIHKVCSGTTGVSVFFVLSGFLITYLLLAELRTNGRINIWYFYARRVLRIWPLYYAVIFFALIVYPIFRPILGVYADRVIQPAYYYTFLSNFDVLSIDKHNPGSNMLIEAITWSVSVEEQFYLVWPLLFFIVPKRYFKAIFLFIILLSLSFRYFNKEDYSTLYYHTLSVCADLAVGGLCAYYALFSGRFVSFFKTLNKVVIITFYIIGIMWMMYSESFLDQNTKPVLTRLISTLFFAFIILEQTFGNYSFFKFSNSRLLTFWGKYTYGLYLLHPVGLLVITIALETIGISESSFLPFFAAFAGLALSLLLSYWSYEYYESKFLQLKDRFAITDRSNLKRKESGSQESASYQRNNKATEERIDSLPSLSIPVFKPTSTS